MARRYVFADECGNFDFSTKPGASKYFVLTSITLDTCDIGHDLLDLRRDMAWRGRGLDHEFHATTDPQNVRDEVFALIGKHDFRIDSTILEKRKAQPSVRCTDDRFYQTAWYQHMKYVAPRIAGKDDELFIVGASVGTKKKRGIFHGAIDDVIKQVSPTIAYKVACWDADSDPCLQIADYCAWALQRKWEMADRRSYDLIKSKIRTEFELFAHGNVCYY